MYFPSGSKLHPSVDDRQIMKMSFFHNSPFGGINVEVGEEFKFGHSVVTYTLKCDLNMIFFIFSMQLSWLLYAGKYSHQIREH